MKVKEWMNYQKKEFKAGIKEGRQKGMANPHYKYIVYGVILIIIGLWIAIMIQPASAASSTSLESKLIYIDVKDGINKTYISNSFQYINPFYTFKFSSPGNFTVQYGLYTHGDESNVWINPMKPPSEKTLGLLIMHELNHALGDPHKDKPDKIINDYLNRVRNYTRPKINNYNGHYCPVCLKYLKT